jgi:septum site-determining protein MinC
MDRGISFSRILKFMMNKPADATHPPAIDIRFGQVGLVQVRIRTTDPGAILDELTGRIATAPRFFERTAVCLDLSALEKQPEIAEIRAVVDAVRRAGMLSIGLTHGSADVDAISGALDMPAPEPGTPALLHHQPVRSGQRVYARGRDLVVTATVGAGAEVMADGCVHIYGSLRGRAMAGAHGELSSRVFCQEFNAELVSIAGVFRVFETIPAEFAGKPVQAWLAGDDLHFARIGA